MDVAGSENPATQASQSSSQLTADEESQADALFQWTRVKHLIAQGSTEQLTKGVATASSLLSDFETILRQFGDNPDILDLVNAILDLQERANPRGAVVGVVGSTGAGKSSIINAVLDEECLVPTSSMRACTAAITEISWNSDEDPAKQYRAEVEFIKAEDWEQELRVLFSDLIDLNGQTPEDITNPDSTAGITLAKVRAVYPSLSNDDFLQGVDIVDKLVQDEKVNDVLGVTMCLHADSAHGILEQLQPFIDSKEKNRAAQSEDDETTMSTWPLVKVVRIYAKAAVLRSGLVLVDLPGVHDSNAARAAMAQDYMKKCNAIWVVAPITRAVDDKSAHALMGVTTQQQLQLDGTFCNITMICSKADDISVTEVTKRLRVDENYSKKLADIDVEITESKQLLDAKRAALDELDQRIKDCDSVRKANEKRMAELASALGASKGDDIMVSPGKHNLARPSLPKAKRVLRTAGSDSDDSSDSDSDSDENEEAVSMSKVQVKEEMDLLRNETKEQKEAKKTLKSERKPLCKEVKALEKTHEKTLKDKRRQLCIEFRNSYSRSAVQTWFKQSIQGHEQEKLFVADKENEEDIDVSPDAASCDEMARKLPVFCVSSRAYLKLTGKLTEDEAVRGFETAWDTEIPYLQEHALNTADEFRSRLCRRFLNDFLQIIRSLVLQLLMEEKPLELEKELRQKELDYFRETWATLRLDLGTAELELNRVIKGAQKEISRKLTRGVRIANAAAEGVVADWFKPTRDGGLHYMTFAAACRRKGQFGGRDPAIDLNEDLAKALKQAVARRWERVFTEKIPSALDRFGATTSNHLRNFRVGSESRRQLKRSANAFRALSELIQGYEQAFGDMAARKEFVAEAQKEVSRAMTPAIAQSMGPTYHDCLGETGSGCYKRIKALVFSRVKEDDEMFELAATKVREQLKDTFSELEDTRNHKYIAAALSTISKRYDNLITGTKIFASLKEVRAQLRDLLDGADVQFELAEAGDAQMTDVDDAHHGEDDQAPANVAPAGAMSST